MVALATLSVLVVCEVSAKEEEAQGVSRGADKWFEPMTKVATAKIGRTPAGVNKSGLLFGGILSILTPHPRALRNGDFCKSNPRGIYRRLFAM